MHERKKLFRLKKTVPALFVLFCLIFALSSRLELSAKAESNSVTVGPTELIQAAINNATAGETIYVSPGIYNESLQVNQTVSLIGEDPHTTFIDDNSSSQFIVDIEADNVTIQGFTIECTFDLNPTNGVTSFLFGACTITNDIIENAQQGINLTYSDSDTISNNLITNNTQQGITLSNTLTNTVLDNVITDNSQYGIYLTDSSYNLFSTNVITYNDFGGIYMVTDSSYNLFSTNVITDNFGGIYMDACSSNTFSGNTFANNTVVGDTIGTFCFSNTFYDNNFYDTLVVGSSPNYWNFGGQGNYWSSFVGQNRGDGISSVTYPVTSSGNNIDNYPLMGEFSSFTATFANQPYQVSVISNSTISGFLFEVGTETGNEVIQLNVTGAEGTDSFSRISIPTALMNTSVTVLVGDKEVTPTWLNVQKEAYNNMYITYASGTQNILIISSETLDLYNQLNATYSELFGNYSAQLNNIYNEFLTNYTNLLGNYTQLQQAYQALNASYQQHLQDENQNQQNVHSLMYIFAAAIAIVIVATIFFSKRIYSQPKEPLEKREPILSQHTNPPVNNHAPEKNK